MRKRLDSIQSMRGLAAIMVLFFHLDVFLPGSPTLHYLFAPGNKGVYIFFVVSGFIMEFTTQDKTHTALHAAKSFATRRLIRIIPLYYAALLAMTLVLHKVPFYLYERPDLFARALAFIPSFEGSTAPVYGSPVLFVGWTLNYEMYFYLLFAISLVFGKHRFMFLCSLFLFLIFVLPFLTQPYITLDYDKGYHFEWNYLNLMTNPAILFFITGVLWARTIPHLQWSKNVRVIVFWICAILFIPSYLDIFTFLPHYISDLVFINLLVGSAALLSFGESPARLPKFLVYTGNMSYSIYLIHAIVVVYLPGFLRKFGFSGLTNSWPIYVLLVIVTLAASIVSYELIERRLTDWLRSNLGKAKKSETIHDLPSA